MATAKPVPVEPPAKAIPLEPGDPIEYPAALGATFAERKAAREARDSKQVSAKRAENKAVTKSESK